MTKKQQKPQRGTVTVRMAIIDDYLTVTELEAIIANVMARAKIENINDVHIRYETTRGYYDDVSVEMFIEGRREETDEEYNMRLANEERARENRRDWEHRRLMEAAQEKRQREYYEQLKAKYEGVE